MILTIAGNAAQFIVLLLITRLATSYLSPEEMGRLSLVTAATAFFALFLVNPVGMFINRRLHAWDATGRARYYLQLHWLYLLAVCAIAALSLAALNLLQLPGMEISTAWLCVLVCGALLFNTVNQTVIPSLNLLEFRGRYVVLTAATLVAGLVCAVLLVHYFRPSAEYWLLGLLIGQTLLAMVGVQVLFQVLQPPVPALVPTLRHGRVLFNFAWPVAIAVALSWAQAQGYRFFVMDSIGLAGLGLFVVGYGISAGLMAGFESVLTTFFQPKFYKGVNSASAANASLAWRNYAGAMLPSLILVMLLLAGLAPELTKLLVGPDYQSASQYVVWGVLAEGARVAAGVYSMSAHGKMDTRALMLPNLIGALVCIGLIAAFVPLHGAHGVGLARAASGMVVVVALHFLLFGRTGAGLPRWLLGKAVVLGALLWLVAALGRWLLSNDGSFWFATGLIGLVGLVFLPLSYAVLREYLPEKELIS